MLNHELARARVADHAARAERLAINRQLLASRQPEQQPSRQRWRNRPSPVSVHYADRAAIQA